ALQLAVHLYDALDYWQQSQFGGAIAVHNGTQTEPEEEQAGTLQRPLRERAEQEGEADEPQQRGKTNATATRKWRGLAGTTASQAEAVLGSLDLTDVGEATLPNQPGTVASQATTVPWLPAPAMDAAGELPDTVPEDGGDKDTNGESSCEEEAISMEFPMFTIPVETLLKMTTIEPHEELQAQGSLVVFDRSMGNAAFVSHQWLSKHHPDPELKQLRVLQDALRHLLHKLTSVPVDPLTEVYVPTAQSLPLRDFQSKLLYLWYDYFSCPQLGQSGESRRAGRSGSQLADAIDSIPAYVAECSYFLGLCPVVDCPDDGRVLGPISWAQRGWCRVERVLRELSRDGSWILIQSDESLALVGTELAFVSGAVGEGEFTLAQDRFKLAP
ncbi:ANKS1A, partial [Symbiodinium necroappetens]